MTDPRSQGPREAVARPPLEGEERRQRVGDEAVGQRLDVLLARWLPASRAEVRRLLAAGRVSLDGRPLAERSKGRAVALGEELVVRGFEPAATQRIEPGPLSGGETLGILASGPGWLVVDKPAGVAVHPLHPEERGSVLNAVAALYPEVQGVGEGGLRSGVVHRLDVETSGCLVVATASGTWERLRGAFARHRVAKRYRAIVLGRLEGERDVELPLRVARHRPARVRVARPGERGGWPSSTRVTPLAHGEGATLVEAMPRTGFLHQIRATLAHLGHPVAGDRVYAASPPVPDPTGAKRQLLHAARVAVDDVEAESTDPPDFRAALRMLGLAAGESARR